VHSILATLLSLTINLSSPVQNNIESLLKPYKNQVGFSLRTLDGKELMSINAQKSFSPASVAKAVSSACSLWELGTAYKFQTEFAYTGNIKNGILNGDLILKAAGDPSFVVEDLKEVLEKIHAVFGIREIKGKLIFDVSYFGKPELSVLNGFDRDKGRSFHAKLTAFPLNHNSFSIWVVPTKDAQPKISLMPMGIFDFKIDNKLKTTSLGKYWVRLDWKPKKGAMVFTGTVPSGSAVKTYYRSLPNPYESHAKLVNRIWSELGGEWPQFAYKISTDSVASKTFLSHQSRPVSRMILDVNKLSTNFASELIFLAAAAKRFGAPTSQDKANRLMADCLSHFQASGIDLKNASGLSRKSLVRAGALTSVLSKLAGEDFSPEYFASLSILGVDGTFKKRLQTHAGQARLKSGSLKGVRSLAGYLYPKKGPPLVMALLFNCSSCGKISKVEDEILKALLKAKK
jgi:D-alanyl-D-alanine carboxypeptidase/D-alanyl-D-alanine-endopeptidase (penicillin-binding protein 4)